MRFLKAQAFFLFYLYGGETMIEPATYDLPPMIRGTNYEWGFFIKTTDGVVKNDLAECTISVVLSNNDGSIDTLISGDGLVIYAAEGAIVLDIDDSVTSTYPLGEIIYKCYITETNGDINIYIEGRIPVRE